MVKAFVRTLLKFVMMFLAITIPAAFIFAGMAIWWLGELALHGSKGVEQFAIGKPNMGWVAIFSAIVMWPYFHVKLYKRLDPHYSSDPPFAWLDEKDDYDRKDSMAVASSSAGYPSYPDNWQELRRNVLERDGYRCVNCGDSIHDATLQVHHIVPLIKGGSNYPGNLVTLCVDCHKKLHPHMR